MVVYTGHHTIEPYPPQRAQPRDRQPHQTYQAVDAETGEEVEAEDRVKGYKLDNDAYVPGRGRRDFDEVALESTHTHRYRVASSARNEVDALYLDESLYPGAERSRWSLRPSR